MPKEIINKAGPLDDDEWKVMRRHTIEGERMLKRIGGVLAEVGRIVRASHEDFDGGGYPDGLAGEAIPIEARIVTCCDAFSAMTTTRSYRKAMPTSRTRWPSWSAARGRSSTPMSPPCWPAWSRPARSTSATPPPARSKL